MEKIKIYMEQYFILSLLKNTLWNKEKKENKLSTTNYNYSTLLKLLTNSDKNNKLYEVE